MDRRGPFTSPRQRRGRWRRDSRRCHGGGRLGPSSRHWLARESHEFVVLEEGAGQARKGKRVPPFRRQPGLPQDRLHLLEIHEFDMRWIRAEPRFLRREDEDAPAWAEQIE